MALTESDYCMLVGKIYAVIGDSWDDSDFFPDSALLNGKILLEPVTPKNALYHYVDAGTSRAKDESYLVEPIEVDLVDSVIRYNQVGYVYLLSRLPGIDRPLQWRVRFGVLTDSKGNKYRPPSFCFDTVPGGTVSLAQAAPVTGYEATGTTVGPQGERGPAGEPGPAGESAYQTAVRLGFKGTEAQWIASLEGEPGPAGKDGTISSLSVSGDNLLVTSINGDGSTSTQTIAIGEVARTVANDAVTRAETAAQTASEIESGIMAQQEWHIIIAAGQSNVRGATWNVPPDYPTNVQVMAWDSAMGKPTPITGASGSASQAAGDNLGWAVAREYAAQRLPAGGVVVLVDVAAGETGFSSTSLSPAPTGYTTVPNGTWAYELDTDPKNLHRKLVDTINAVKAAMPANSRFVGMHWCQGEQDRAKVAAEGPGWWASRFDDLVARVRSLTRADLPLVVWSPTEPTIKGTDGGRLITAAQSDITLRSWNTTFVRGPRDDWKDNEDIHFTDQGHKIRGKWSVDALDRAANAVDNAPAHFPLGIKAEVQGQDVLASWNPVLHGAAGYAVQYSTDNGATWANAVKEYPASAFALIPGAAANGSVHVRVATRTRGSSGRLGNWSPVVRTPGAPGTTAAALTPSNYWDMHLLTGDQSTVRASMIADRIQGNVLDKKSMTGPLRGKDGTTGYAKFDGTAGMVSSLSGVKTVAVLMRMPTGVTQGGTVNLGGVYFLPLDAGKWKVYISGVGAKYPQWTSAPASSWVLAWASADGSNVAFSVNDQTLMSFASTAPITQCNLSLNPDSTTLPIDVAGVWTYADALTQQQRNSEFARIAAESPLI